MKLGTLVVVEWYDAWFDISETRPNDWLNACPVKTVGYLVRQGDIISVAGEVLEGEETYRAVTHIPKVLLKRPIRRAG